MSSWRVSRLFCDLTQKSFSTSSVNAFKSNKHFLPKFKKLRAMKVVRVEVPSFDEKTQPTSEEIRTKMKERGLVPPRMWQEKPVFIASTGGIFEPYVPPEGDGKISPVTLGGAKQSLLKVGKKGTSLLAIRKIKSYDEDFDSSDFADEAQEIYINMHHSLAEKDEEKLHNLVTEHAFPSVTANTDKNRIRWSFIKSLEPPRVVHARVTNVMTDDNVFGQVTVRFHSQQTLAVYDRFGRLMHGSEITVKDVLEYVVFEKHLSNQYGVWRVHDKIIPNWMPPKEPTYRTYIKPTVPVVEDIAVDTQIKENETVA
ncbi:large ribosomal subunit protein mL45-like [Artemia franciscana]|uniref:Large ribosomal subunit protein mL45 n=1 Tax=Artemia franciscana TaxID=6661 RepID=A0AA88IF57_ARTSF|nr:hypothetical protein QYM36_007873 [Artemia franciscana]CAG4635721.1 EOG090X0DDP [Artemia franciscana]